VPDIYVYKYKYVCIYKYIYIYIYSSGHDFFDEFKCLYDIDDVYLNLILVQTKIEIDTNMENIYICIYIYI
jgi:hypothetical protein